MAIRKLHGEGDLGLHSPREQSKEEHSRQEDQPVQNTYCIEEKHCAFSKRLRFLMVVRVKRGGKDRAGRVVTGCALLAGSGARLHPAKHDKQLIEPQQGRLRREAKHKSAKSPREGAGLGSTGARPKAKLSSEAEEYPPRDQFIAD